MVPSVTFNKLSHRRSLIFAITFGDELSTPVARAAFVRDKSVKLRS
jgi:hypothetical protein